MPDPSSGDKSVDLTTPTGDFGQEDPLPGSTGQQHAQPGLVERGRDVPLPGEDPHRIGLPREQ